MNKAKIIKLAKWVGGAVAVFVVGAIVYRFLKPQAAKVLPANVTAQLP